MNIAAQENLERLVHVSRRHLWVALGIVLLCGVAALVLLALPDSRAAGLARNLMMLLPMVIVCAGAALRSKAKGISMDPSSPALKTLRNDELRQAALHRAYRNGFFALLMAQPLLAVVLTVYPPAYPVALMAGGGAVTGAAVFLASLLYYDR